MVRLRATVTTEGKNVSFTDVDGEDWADDVPVRPPLPLDDRVWRHPSELGIHSTGPVPLVSPASRSMWSVALASGLVGAALATAVLLVLERDGGRSRSGPSQLASVAVSLPRPEPVPTTTMPAVAQPVTTTTTVPTPRTTTTMRVVTTTMAVPVTTVAPATTVAPVAAPLGPQMVSVRGSDAGQGPIGAIVLAPDLVAVPTGALVGPEAWVSWPEGVEVSGQVLGTDAVLGVTFVGVPSANVPAQAASGTTAVSTGGQVMVQQPDGTGVPATITEIGCSGIGPGGDQLWAMVGLDTPVPTGTIVFDGAGVVGMVVAPDDDGPGSIVAPVEVLGALADTRAATGTMQRAWLGMSVGGDERGAPVVTEVQPGSPAEAAGVGVGDVVAAIDGHRLDAAGRFLLLAWASSGAPMTIELQRADQTVTLTVTPQLRPVELSASATPAG